jgi:lipoprotein NlpD
VTRAAVVDANRLDNPHTLRTSQRLTIPGCHPPVAAAKEEPTVLSADGSVLRRVGPLRVLTRLVLAQPDFQDERIPLGWPIEGPVVSTFGRRARGWHAGIDISAELGSPILAAAAGTVVFSGWIRAYGQIIKIQHSGGFITLYAHNTQNLVEEGEDVEAGQAIATVGRSGDASGPHVHFEVRRDGKAYNPLHLLEPSDHSPVFEDDVAASSSDLDPHE